MSDAAILLATILQYGRFPATHNAPNWIGFLIPADFLPEVERVLAEELAKTRAHNSRIIRAPN